MGIEIIFDVHSKGCSANISSDGYTVTDPISVDGNYHTYMSSKGWNEGIHVFTIKPGKGSLSNIGIGIMSSDQIQACKDSENLYFLWTKNTQCFAYCMDDARIFETKNGSYKKMVNCKSTFDRSDPLTILVDCNKWTIQYYSNEDAITSALDIIPNKTYHATFSAFPSTLSMMKLVQTPSQIFEN